MSTLKLVIDPAALESADDSTEIRCQEKSKGGLCYEVILAEPNITAALPKVTPITPGKNVSAEEIEEKLKAAEERRLSLEAKKMADWSAKMAKIEEASRKKDDLANEFITHTKEILDDKMQKYENKRDSHISEIKEKLKVPVKNQRVVMEKQKNEERLMALEDKLKTAASIREDKIKKILDRLKEHEQRAEIVRQNKAALASQSNEDNIVTASSG